MFRHFALTLLVLGGVALGTASAYFEWTEVTELTKDGNKTKVFYARVSSDVYDQLLKTGLNATEGTTSTSPVFQGKPPGANKLKLAGKLYQFAGSNGFAEVSGMKIDVLKFVPALAGNFTGKWDTSAYGSGIMTLTQNGDKVTGTYTVKGGN